MFDLIHQFINNGSAQAGWDLVLKFEPLIIKASISRTTGLLDLDLKHEIELTLFERIKNFELR